MYNENLSWEATTMEDHLSWKTTYSWQKVPHFNANEPVTKDHLHWETIFLCLMQSSFETGSTAVHSMSAIYNTDLQTLRCAYPQPSHPLWSSNLSPGFPLPWERRIPPLRWQSAQSPAGTGISDGTPPLHCPVCNDNTYSKYMLWWHVQHTHTPLSSNNAIPFAKNYGLTLQIVVSRLSIIDDDRSASLPWTDNR